MTQEIDTSPVAAKFELGVLLVHGIGTQRRGDTLVRCGDVLLKTIGRATRNKVVTTIERAGPAEWRENGSLEAAIRLRAGNHTERWLLREGRWADAFPAPSYREIVSWSVRAVPWSIATHIAETYWQSSRHWGRARIVALVRAVGQLLVALLLAPVLISLLGLTLLLGLLPIPQVRTLILLTQSTLTATVGDSLAFVESPVRAALIRECILDGQRRLKQLCKYTVIVAHSQGAAAVLDALGGIRESDEEQHEAEATTPLVPDALVTFGAGTNQLASQKVLAAGPKIAWNPASSAVIALLGATGVLFWLYWSVRAQQITVAEILWGLLLVFPVFVVTSLVYWRAWIWARTMSARARSIVAVMVGAVVLVMWLSLVGYQLYVNPTFHLYPLSLLILTSILVTVSMYLILSRNMEKIVTAPVQMPLGLNRWVDLYASADPVPNGRTRMRSDDDRYKSIPIWNSGSRFADHTTYWDNRDGFVLRVARVCAETARSPWTDALPGESDFADKRAAWRVGFLQIARWCSGLTLLVLGTFLWTEHQGSIPVPFDLPSWFPAAPVKLALLVALIGFAMWTTASALRWPWSRWTRVEQDVVLAQGELGEEEDGVALWAMAAIVWMLIIATLCIMFKVDLTDPSTFGVFLFSPMVPGALSSLVLQWLKRGPKCSSTSDRD